jgi:M6 family metalloprotease-like protein
MVRLARRKLPSWWSAALALALLGAAPRAARAIDAPPPWVVDAMLDAAGVARPALRAIGGARVYVAGSPCCHYHVDGAGFPVELVAGEWVYASAPSPSKSGARRVLASVGEVDPRKLMSESERRELAATFCRPEASCTPVPPDPDAPLERGAQPATMGFKRNLALLIRWSDHASTKRTLPSRANFTALLTAEGKDAALFPTGSVRSYYLAQSRGALDFSSVASEWIDVPYTERDAAAGLSGLGFLNGDSKLHRAILYALDQFAAINDMSQFDMDLDGNIDGLTVIHSGYGAEWGGSDQLGAKTANRIWSHKWSLIESRTYNGVYIRSYNINPALWGTSGTGIGRIGVLCHELGHFFGLPDLYDGTAPVHATFGTFGIMSGAWGVDGSQRYPGSFSPWSREQLGWANVSDIGESGTKTLLPYASSGQLFKVTSGFPSNEYLLVEARSNDPDFALHDSQLPAGIYVWHIDNDPFNNWNNDGGYPGDGGAWPRKHDRIRLIQADNQWHNEKLTWWRSDANDAYKSVHQVLSDESGPALLSYEQLYKSAADCRTTGNALSQFAFNNTGKSTFVYTKTASEPCTPTSAPTTGTPTQPSAAPTRAPSKAPTKQPTSKPSTKQPSRAPTAAPSLQPTTSKPTTGKPTTRSPTTSTPTTGMPTTSSPTTGSPTTGKPTTSSPTTSTPTTSTPTTSQPTTAHPTTGSPSAAPSRAPTSAPTAPSTSPTTPPSSPTKLPTTSMPPTGKPTTSAPTTSKPTTGKPTTGVPTTTKPTAKPTSPTKLPTTSKPTTGKPTTRAPTTRVPTTSKPTAKPTSPTKLPTKLPTSLRG